MNLGLGNIASDLGIFRSEFSELKVFGFEEMATFIHTRIKHEAVF